jgi:type II secretory pathway component GspD/PulD (secretin)
LVYERSGATFQKVLLSNPALVVPPVERSLVYDEAPIERIFSDLSKVYGISIVFDSEVLKKCTVSADLTNEPFYRKLDLICTAIDAHYEVIDGQVVIESSGCK